MFYLRLLLYCAILFYIPGNGEQNFIRLILKKHTPYNSTVGFRENVKYYKEVLQFFFDPTTEGVIRGKIDKNIDYYAEIQLGAPKPREIKVAFDTSFSGFWVPSSSCTLSWVCYKKNHYNSTTSSDYVGDVIRNQPETRTITYKLDNTSLLNQVTEINGTLGFDTLWIGGVKILGTHFMEAKWIDFHPFSSFISDGVFGFGFPSNSLRMSPPFFTMLDRGVLDKPEFSLFLGPKNQNGELLFGGINETFYNPESFRFHPLSSTDKWMIQINSTLFNTDEFCPSSCDALIDTGTALIAAPIGSLKSIYTALNLNYTGEIAEVNCTKRGTMPLLKININGQVITLNGYDYTIEMDAEKGRNCLLAIMESPKDVLWIFGNVFLSTVYTVFNVGSMEIGFATF